jgi:4-amino-4-deoxy-L-arabinose transferase-like glycosyltransferase
MAEEPVPERLLEAVTKLQADYAAAAAANHELAQEFARRKREFRWVALCVVLLVAVVTCALMVMRHFDRAEEERRREALAGQLLTQRQNLVDGCERGNDARRSLAQVIITSFQPGPPIALPPGYEGLQTVLDQSAAQSAAKREALLALPGLQIVDCQAAFPVAS